MIESQKHRCVAPDCYEAVPNDLLMCRRHWGAVPGGLRTTIYRAWNEHRAQPTADSRHVYAGWVKKAIASLEEKRVNDD